MAWRVLISAPYAMPVIDWYREQLEPQGVELIVATVDERLSEQELLGMIGDIDGVICGDDRFTEEVFAAAPRLGVISKWGTGIDSIDQAAAERYGVKVCNTPNAFSEPVADTVLGYALAFARNIPGMDRAIKRGEWWKPRSVTLQECTFGIVGAGNAGRTVARRAHAFGCTLLANDIIDIPKELIEEVGLSVVALDELLGASDFVTLHVDLNPTSYHLIGEPQLELMSESAYLINTSRGSVVDEPALVRALQSGTIAGAALDVFEEEPLPQSSPLRGMDNVLLGPHNANSSPRFARRVHENTVENLLRELRAGSGSS